MTDIANDMRWVALIVVAACASGGSHPPPKPPNEELIVGDYERHPPDGTTVARFKADGSIEIAHDRTSLGPHDLATGTFDLKGDALTLTYTGGEMCKGSGPGHYKIVISKIGIRFTKLDDPCDQRSKMDGQTWFRAN
jgi:hypothetical protein